MSCWNSDLGVLQEQPVPLTTEPSLASRASALIFTRTVADWLLAMCLDLVLGFCLVYLMESRTVTQAVTSFPLLTLGLGFGNLPQTSSVPSNLLNLLSLQPSSPGSSDGSPACVSVSSTNVSLASLYLLNSYLSIL